jgi:hypothetical protein
MSRKFNELLNEELENLAIGPEAKSKFELVKEIAKELTDAKGRVRELEEQFQRTVDELNFQLGISIRQKSPKLAVNLNNGACQVGYKSRALICRPDIDRWVWNFEPTEWGRRFSRTFGPNFPLNDVDKLAQLIQSFFQGRFKTLR